MNVRAFERRDTPHVADLLEEMPEAFTAQGRQLFLRDATTQSALVAEDNEGPTGYWCGAPRPRRSSSCGSLWRSAPGARESRRVSSVKRFSELLAP